MNTWIVTVELADGTVGFQTEIKSKLCRGKVWDRKYAAAFAGYEFPRGPRGEYNLMDMFTGWCGYDDEKGKMVPLYRTSTVLKK